LSGLIEACGRCVNRFIPDCIGSALQNKNWNGSPTTYIDIESHHNGIISKSICVNKYKDVSYNGRPFVTFSFRKEFLIRYFKFNADAKKAFKNFCREKSKNKKSKTGECR